MLLRWGRDGRAAAPGPQEAVETSVYHRQQHALAAHGVACSSLAGAAALLLAVLCSGSAAAQAAVLSGPALLPYVFAAWRLQRGQDLGAGQ